MITNESPQDPQTELSTRLLVVDDDRNARRHVSRILQRTGAIVDTSDTEQAMICAAHHHYSVIYLAPSVTASVAQHLVENLKHIEYDTRFVLLGAAQQYAHILEREGVLAGVVSSAQARDELLETSAFAFDEALERRRKLASTPPPPQEGPVLVLQQDQAQAEYLRLQLETLGFQVHAVDSARRLHDAIERVDEGYYALAIVDTSQRAPEGLDVISQLSAADPRLAIVMLHDDDCELCEQALAYGVLELVPRAKADTELPVAVRRARLRNLANQALRFRATHDALTRLYNRDHFGEVLRRGIARTSRKSSGCGLIYIDLDDFKPINDRYGHAAGDLVLKTVAGNLQQTLRRFECAARLGGDEFVILIEDVVDIGELSAVAERVLQQLSEPIVLASGEVVQVHGSLGVALSTDPEATPSDLMEAADTAMFRAKDAGGNQCCVAEESVAKEVESRRRMKSELRAIKPSSELFLLFQPQFDVAKRTIVSFEALLRWRRQDSSTVSPTTFVPMLEQMGMGVEVGNWVLREATASAAIWARRNEREVRVAVNVSPSQLEHPGFASYVEQVLFAAGLEPERLEIEVTESTLARNSSRIHETLLRISELGAKIVLDDFGTNYAALNHLKHYPLSGLKIDRPFIRSLVKDASSRAMVGMIIDLAHQLDIRVAAVGVEQLAQARYLRERRCDVYQGYLFGRPHFLCDTRTNMSRDVTWAPSVAGNPLRPSELPPALPPAPSVHSCMPK